VRYVFRDFPIDHIHPYARKASEAARCAGDQGKCWKMHDLLFQSQQSLAPSGIVGWTMSRYANAATKEDTVVDFNEYSAELLVRDKLSPAHAEAERRRALCRTARPPRHRARYAVGRLLLRLGRRLGDGIEFPAPWAPGPNPAGGPAGSTR